MSEILARAYASAPKDEVIYPTLEFLHPALPDGAIRIVRGFEDMTACLETGEWVEFEASGAEWTPPGQDGSGANAIEFGVGNVDGVVQHALEAIDAWRLDNPFAEETFWVVTRDYVASDLTAPQLPPAKMEVTDARIQLGTANVTAEPFPTLSMAWPRQYYTTRSAPGLRYV